jgi:hypothetical protein
MTLAASASSLKPAGDPLMEDHGENHAALESRME